MSVVQEVFAALSLVVDREAFRSGDGALNALKSTAKELGAVMAGAFAVSEIIEFTRETLDALPAIGDVADAAGVTAESLQRLRFAFENSGSDAATLDGGLLKLSKNIGEAAKGNDDLRKTFAGLGVSLRDSAGRLRTADDVLLDVADGLAGVTEPAKRAEIATALLGLSGQKLIPGLKGGAGALGELGDEAERLGIVVGRDAIDAVGAVDDRIKNVSASFTGAARNLVVSFLPAIEAVAEGFALIARAANAGARVIKRFAPAIMTVAAIVGVVLVGKLAMATAAWVALTVAQGFAAMSAGAVLPGAFFAVITVIDALIARVTALAARFLAFVAPAAAVGATILLVGLLIDELITAIQGGDTFFGNLIGRFGELKEALFSDISPEDSWIVDLLRFIAIMVVDVFDKIDRFFAWFFDGIGSIADAVQSFVDNPLAALQAGLDLLMRAAKFAGKVLDPFGVVGKTVDAVAPYAADIVDPFGVARGAGKFIAKNGADIIDPFGVARGAIDSLRPLPGAGGGVAVGAPQVSINVDARGSTMDGKQLAADIGAASSSGIDQAVRAASVDLLAKGK